MNKFLLGLALSFLAFTVEAQVDGFTVVRSFGPVTLAQDADNFLPNASGQAIPGGIQFVLIRTQQINWTLTGGQALSFNVEWSADQGITWSDLGGDFISDEIQGGTRGVPLGEFRQLVEIPNVGNRGRRARLHYHFFKPLRVQGTIEVQ